MKYLSRSALILVLALATTAVISLSAQAQEQPAPSEQQIEHIRQNCTSAQVTMQRVQQSDIAARINIGRAYDALITRQMAPLNSRMALNRINIAPELSEVTTSLEGVLSDFRDNYSNYTDTLSRAIRMKCQDNPMQFYERLQSARQLRKDLAENVTNMERLTSQYGTEVATFTEELKKSQVAQ